MAKKKKAKTEEVQMTETVVKQSVETPVPFKNTTVGKTVRTFLQVAGGVVLLFATNEEFRNFVSNNFPELALYIPLAGALITAIQNALDPTVKNI